MCTIGSDCMCSSYVYSSVYWVELQDSEGSYMILRYAVFMLTLNLQAESINKARYSKPAQAVIILHYIYNSSAVCDLKSHKHPSKPYLQKR